MSLWYSTFSPVFNVEINLIFGFSTISSLRVSPSTFALLPRANHKVPLTCTNVRKIFDTMTHLSQSTRRTFGYNTTVGSFERGLSRRYNTNET